MRIVIVNKSDSTGGAAVVSFRLMTALRSIGVDARMLVAEKLTDSPYVALAAPHWKIKGAFIADRLRIAMANGFDRKTLFKLDAAVAGIDITRHPWVRKADAIFLNWINQGLLSLKDIERLGKTGKRIVWTMHDMWNMTGLCHHAGECRHYRIPGHCGDCPLLAARASARDLSHKMSLRKERLYDSVTIDFVAVSSWLKDRAKESSLLAGRHVSVIPNAFQLPDHQTINRDEKSRDDRAAATPVRLIFGAARLDDDIKGFPILIEALAILRRKYPKIAERASILLYGSIKDASLLDAIPLRKEYTGMLRNPEEIRRLYRRSDIVVSSSLFETLPGTLVEGQAYGCLPVTFGRGGQRDIVEPGLTGIIVDWNDDAHLAAEALADGIAAGAALIEKEGADVRRRMYQSVKNKFEAESVAKAYMNLLADKTRIIQK